MFWCWKFDHNVLWKSSLIISIRTSMCFLYLNIPVLGKFSFISLNRPNPFSLPTVSGTPKTHVFGWVVVSHESWTFFSLWFLSFSAFFLFLLFFFVFLLYFFLSFFFGMKHFQGFVSQLNLLSHQFYCQGFHSVLYLLCWIFQVLSLQYHYLPEEFFICVMYGIRSFFFLNSCICLSFVFVQSLIISLFWIPFQILPQSVLPRILILKFCCVVLRESYFLLRLHLLFSIGFCLWSIRLWLSGVSLSSADTRRHIPSGAR